MKLQALKRYNKDDYPNAADWFLTFLDNLNSTIDILNPLLTHNIDLDNNILGERQTVTLTHATPISIKMRSLKQQPRFVRVGFASGYVGIGAISTYNTDGTLMVTVYFQGTLPTAPVSTVLYFEP